MRAAAADEAQAEIAALRDSLARAEQGMADGFAAADALLTELTVLATLRRAERRALARAERELKERNGSISASQAEVAELRDKLAAARETGKAALASLRYQAVAAAEAPRGGWLAPMLRRIGSRTAGQLQRFSRKEAVVTLADRANSARQWQRAAHLYRTALDRNPLNPPIWVQYGHSLKETGKLAQAEGAYRRAIADEPTVADSHLQLGHVLKLQGRIEEARAAYLRCLALDPSTPHVWPELEGFGWSQEQAAELRGMLGSDGVQPSGPYAHWVARYDTLNDADRAAIRAHIAELAKSPLISVVVPVYNTDEAYLREMIESVLQQLYPHWELCLADDASTEPHIQRVLREFSALDSRIKFVRRETNGHIAAATNTALDLAVGEFVALLDHDDLLSETALYEIAVELDAHPHADVIYSDSDNIDDLGQRSVPYFKTDWNPDLMLGHNMVSHLGVYRRSLLEKVGRLRVGFEGSQDYDLMLRAAEASPPSRIRHIPAVLYHWRRNGSSASFSEASMERCVVAARRAIRQHLERTGVQARIEAAPKAPIWTRVIYLLPRDRPLVSIIVPTRDRSDLLARCADGVLTRTEYEPLELLIVDNDSVEAETERVFRRLGEDSRVRIIRHPGNFNYPAINNRAVREARGDVVVLMNNDVDVISSGWLEEMVSHALRPEVGAVGAKLLYPDGRVQHAGVVLGVGHGAGHFFAGRARDDGGSWGFLSMVRRVSAVTAACLALRRSVYLEVGGLDEVNFAVALNDVDLCLRIGERGYAVVWTPHAELYHLESATRGRDVDDPESSARLERDAEKLKQRWGENLSRDPFYNPNCSLTTADFEPGFPPARRKPWLTFKGAASQSPPPAAISRAETLLAPIGATDLQKPVSRAPSILDDVYVSSPPSAEAAFRIFDGAWSSNVPGSGLDGVGLFDDQRIKWFEQQCGGVKGKRILELGPLEGGHTYMLSQAGAASITSIESNTIAFLKCLIVQNVLKFNADFIFGDFRPYLDTCTDTYDLLVASGVLYHMTEPIKLLQDMAKVSAAIGVWTHYYDADVILKRDDLKREFHSDPLVQHVGSREIISYKQSYLDALNWKGFCGGAAPTSYWLTKESIVGILSDLGFKVVIGEDAKEHPNGPAMTLYASRECSEQGVYPLSEA